MTNYWINVVSKNHVSRGVTGGFTQANHGKPHMLKKMQRGDWIIFYSPKTEFNGNEKLQAFTAIGQIIDDEPYQVQISPNFHPYRRKVSFKNAHDTPIRPLIDKLDFIENKTHWGYKFRFGVIKISEHDFHVIAQAMATE
ncbi:MAG: EVE domain-containing protein [Micrococcaceae bacterium]